MARPHQLTSDIAKGRKLTKKMCGFIERGSYPEVAARNCGIGARTYYEWRKQGEEDQQAGLDTAFTEFLEAVDAAIAKAEEKLIKVVNNNIPEDGRLALEVLSRRFPYRWARPRDRQAVPSDTGAASAKPLAELLTEIAINASAKAVGAPKKDSDKSATTKGRASVPVDDTNESKPAS